MDVNKGRSAHGAYGDNVEEMDWSVGRVLDLLEARGELADTLVYFASDNGPFREELDEGGSCGYAPLLPSGAPLVTRTRDGWSQPFERSAAPLKGAKAQTWECGLRVPAILAYPARWAGGMAVHVATTAMDVLPTVLAIVDDGGAAEGRGSDGGGGLRDGLSDSRFQHVSELARAGGRRLDRVCSTAARWLRSLTASHPRRRRDPAPSPATLEGSRPPAYTTSSSITVRQGVVGAPWCMEGSLHHDAVGG